MPEATVATEPGTSAREMVVRIERRLREAGRMSARPEAEWLVSAALDRSRAELYLSDIELEPQILDRLAAWTQQRIQGAPLQYVTGWTEFCGLRLAVDPSVLVPRPETEGLVEALIQRLRGHTAPTKILELGTGSGAIAIALARGIPPCLVIGVELSWDALRTATGNIQRHGLAERVRLVCGDWAESIRGSFDVIVSNPPYVPTAELSGLPEDVRREPRMSLDGGPDGMGFHPRTIAAAESLLKPGGWLACECDERQAERLAQLVHTAWKATPDILSDLAGRPRGIVARRPMAGEASA
jgi:release factor glutamine methyltransferase